MALSKRLREIIFRDCKDFVILTFLNGLSDSDKCYNSVKEVKASRVLPLRPKPYNLEINEIHLEN